MGGMGNGLLQQDLIHDSAAQEHLAGGLKTDFLAVLDIGKVRGGGSDVHHQYRFGQDVISHLQMLGLAGTDQSGPGFRDDAGRRISHLFKDLTVLFPSGLVPSSGASDVEAAVLVLDQIAVEIQFTENSGRKALHILGAFLVREELALEADLPFHCVGVVTGVFADEKIVIAKPRISGNETLAVSDGQYFRNGLAFFVQTGDGALGISKIKSKKPVHDQSPPEARPFFRRVPSLTSAGRRVPSLKEGIKSNHAACSAV